MLKMLANNKADKLADEEGYLDYEHLCDFLGISYGTARNWKSRGKLTYTNFHGKIYFPKKYILKELKKNISKSPTTILEEKKEKTGS